MYLTNELHLISFSSYSKTLLMQIARNRNLVLKKDVKKRKLKKKTLLKKRDPDPDPDPESAFY